MDKVETGIMIAIASIIVLLGYDMYLTQEREAICYNQYQTLEHKMSNSELFCKINASEYRKAQ